MNEYHKIETLFERDPKTFIVDPTQLKAPVFGTISKWDVTEKINSINIRVMLSVAAHWSDKEICLRLHEFPENVRKFIFPYRKNGGDLMTGKVREGIFRAIRPTGNVLPGYTPSYAMNRVVEESL